jgi:hypothetical protein
MSKIIYSPILVTICLTFFFQCKKNTGQSESHFNITLYNQPLSVIQSNIQGKWQLRYQKGGITGGTYPVTQTVYDSFSLNRITVITDVGVATDTAIIWKRDLAVNISGDSTFLMTYYDKSGFPQISVVDGIFNDSLVLHDNSSDPFYYHFSKSK